MTVTNLVSKFILTLGMVFAISSVSSCAYLKEAIGLGPMRPKVSVEEIQVMHVSLQALSLAVVLNIKNPNNFDLKLKNLKYSMVTSKLTLAAGEYKEEIVVPKSGASKVKLPVAVNPSLAFSIIKQLVANGPEVLATIAAEADFATPFGDTEVSFEETKALTKFAGM